MKKYTHAWLASMAVKRLDDVAPDLTEYNNSVVNSLVRWFKNHRDDVVQGSWYPDAVIKDMSSSHVLKISPSNDSSNLFKKLPSTHLMYEQMKDSPLKAQSFAVDKKDNLPDRCEAIAHSVVDNMKMQNRERKGSPVSPSSNHVALLLYMLSHYIADAHVPFHCDSRRFSSGKNIHAHVEGEWDDQIKKYFDLDSKNNRFFYNKFGFPLRKNGNSTAYKSSYLHQIENTLTTRKFRTGYGEDNGNTWDFMSAICQYSYLMSHAFIPGEYDHTTVDLDNWDSLGTISFDEMSVSVLADAIDSIARVWFRVWRRYMKWAA